MHLTSPYTSLTLNWSKTRYFKLITFCIVCIMAVHCMTVLRRCGPLPARNLPDVIGAMWPVMWLYIACVCCGRVACLLSLYDMAFRLR